MARDRAWLPVRLTALVRAVLALALAVLLRAAAELAGLLLARAVPLREPEQTVKHREEHTQKLGAVVRVANPSLRLAPGQPVDPDQIAATYAAARRYQARR
jgi:hypothetical protein